MNTRDDYAYQKETSGDWSHEEAREFQNKAAEDNPGPYYGSVWNGSLNISKNLSSKKQMTFLRDYYELYNNADPLIKAKAAKNLRDEIRNKTKFNLNGLFMKDEIFMNESLRDFLNTSDTGLEYTISDVSDYSKGWREIIDDNAKMEHQYNTQDKSNRKFVNDLDGREAIFTKDGKFIQGGINKGTFNYAQDVSSWYNGWHSFGEHGRWDMNPFFRQYGLTPTYRSIFGHWFYSDEYGTYGKRSLERSYHEHH